MNDSTQHSPARLPPAPASSGPLRLLVGLAAFVILVQGVSSARAMIEPLLLALLLAVGMAPAIGWMVRRRVPVPVALLLLLSVMLSLGAGVGALFVQSANDFVQQLPSYEQRLRDGFTLSRDWLAALHPALDVGQLLAGFDPAMAMDYAGVLLGGFGNLLGNGLLILLVVVFLLLESTGLRAKLALATGNNTAMLSRLDHIAASINRYLALKTLFSFINGVAVTLLLWIAGVDYALLWGVLAFLFNFVPGVGLVLSIIPPMLMGWLQGGAELMLVAGIGCLVIGTLVGNWLEPKYLGEGLGLSTFVVILSLVLWGWVLGPVGMLLSVPLTMILKIVLEASPPTHGIAVLLGTGKEAGTAGKPGGKEIGAFAPPTESTTAEGSSTMFKVNEYFDGKVKSISFTSARGATTTGVMAAGEYEFNTGKPEVMVITSGSADVQLKGETIWMRYGAGGSFDVPGNSSFRIRLAGDTTYLCYFVG